MKIDMRKQAVTGALIKDNTADWKNIANKEIEENKNLKEQINSLEKELSNKDTSNIIEIDPKKCRNWKYADRNRFELGSIEELAEDIKQNGQLQPAIVRKIDSLDYAYEVIAGERRWRAAKLAGLKDVPVYIREADDQKVLELALLENLQRENLNAIEIGLSYQRLMDECAMIWLFTGCSAGFPFPLRLLLQESCICVRHRK